MGLLMAVPSSALKAGSWPLREQLSYSCLRSPIRCGDVLGWGIDVAKGKAPPREILQETKGPLALRCNLLLFIKK